MNMSYMKDINIIVYNLLTYFQTWILKSQTNKQNKTKTKLKMKKKNKSDVTVCINVWSENGNYISQIIPVK